MADVTITNLTTSPLLIQDLYTTIAASGSITVSRSPSELANMTSLQTAVASGYAAVTVVLTDIETASGLAVSAGSVQAADMAPVASTALDSAEITIRKAFTAGAGGSADDVTIYAVNTLPYKIRILNVSALISAAVALSTIQVRSAAGGAGTLCAELSSATTGYQAQTATVTASQVLTPGASVGLFIRRSDNGAAGEVIIKARREI